MKNKLTTIGGIMAGLLLIPDAIGTTINQFHLQWQLPAWAYIACTFLGKMGVVVVGVGAQDAMRSDK